MNIFRTSIVLTVALAVATSAVAGSRKAEKIADRYVKAMGGKKLRSIETMRVAGVVSMMGIEAPFFLRKKRPNRTRMDINMLGADVTQSFDGDRAWWVNPFAGAPTPREMPPDFAQQFERWTDMESPLVDYRRKRHRLRYVGEASDANGAVHVIEVTMRSGAQVTVLFDKETYLEVQRSYDQSYNGRTRRVDTHFSNYQEVDGVMTPFTIRGADLRGEPFVMWVDRWEFDIDIDDETFNMPASAKEKSEAPAPVTMKGFSTLAAAFNNDKRYVRSVAVLSPT